MLIDPLVDFVAQLTLREVLYYFWPFFIFDAFRYTVLDVLLLTVFMPRRRREATARAVARRRLYREMPLVSVIAPGRNEGAHIPGLVRSLRRQTYRHIEVVVVDDGSDDDTPMIARRFERDGLIHRFLRNDVRGGKASAANTALRFARGRYIIHLDADSNLRHDAIEHILLPFYMESNIGAVGGDLRVDNLGESFATRLQGIEYIKALTTGRTVTSLLGILRMVSGAYGAFRRDALDRVGGWDIGPGLDGDLVLKLRKLGYQVVHQPDAVCYTNVPNTFRGLARQRYRWDRSMVRFRLRKHRDLLTPSANFDLRNFFSSVDNIFFSFVLNFKWWAYLAQMLMFHPTMLPYILPINYSLYLIANLIQYGIACTVFQRTLRREDVFQFAFLPLMPLYMGVFLRLVRTFAQIMELFHRASFYDRWNPWKVSAAARSNRM